MAINAQGIVMNQRKYALELIAYARLYACKPATSPMDSKAHLQHNLGDPFKDVQAYRRMIGQLLYLTTTRLDISFAVQQLSQFLAKPTSLYHHAALRVLKYIKGTPGLGLYFPTNSTVQLKVYSDSDWAACLDTRKSITGYYVFLGSALISWKSKKQTTVSRNSFESEYQVMAATTYELKWLTYLLQDLKVPLISPALLNCDNQSAMHITANQCSMNTQSTMNWIVTL